MKETRILMGMPITVEIVDGTSKKENVDKVFDYFKLVDNRFSTYKDKSEISLINNGSIKKEDFSKEMEEIFNLSLETEKLTEGYFNIINKEGIYDPSGIVKGWSIYKASSILWESGFNDFYIEAGGDIQTSGKNSDNEKWKVGIRNPVNSEEIIKIVELSGEGIATSGSYIRGDHIYNPNNNNSSVDDIISLTIIGPNVYEADRFATSAYAMGLGGINFIEKLADFEGYIINNNSIAVSTSNFEKYIKNK